MDGCKDDLAGKTCAICGKKGGELQPIPCAGIYEIVVHNYKNKGLLIASHRGKEFYFGVTLLDNRFICARCEEVTRLFEDFFDAFDYTLYDTSFIKPLVNWVYRHLQVIPKGLKRGSYLPNARCEEALRGAGIDLAKAKAEVAENWREKLRRLGQLPSERKSEKTGAG